MDPAKAWLISIALFTGAAFGLIGLDSRRAKFWIPIKILLAIIAFISGIASIAVLEPYW